MKRTMQFLLLLTAMMLTSSKSAYAAAEGWKDFPNIVEYDGNELWSGTQVIDNENGQTVVLAASLLGDLQVGDVLHATITDVTKGATTDNRRATVAIQTPYSKDKWPFLEGFLAIDEATTEVTFTLTGDIIYYIKQQGLIVGGKGYTLTSLFVEPAVYKGSENSIWLGQETSTFTINSEHFKNANDLSGIVAGDIIRLSFTKNGNGWMQLKYMDADAGFSWKDLPNVTFTDTDTGRDYAVTEEMATIMNKYGLIINFENRTITQVEIVKPTPTKGTLWSGTQVIDGENGQTVVLSAKLLSDLEVGYVLHATIANVTTGWASKVTLQLPDGDQRNLEEDFALTKPTTDVAFTLTGDIVRYAKQYGLMLGGKGYTLTKVYVESSGNTGSENSIWVGHIDGSANITIRSPHFKNANDLAGIAKGDVIRLTYAKKDEAWIQLKYNGEDTNWEWTNFDDAVISETESGANIEVTASMVNILKTDGMIINFGNMEFMQVEIVKPAPAEGTLWTGNKTIDTDNGKTVVLAASLLGDLQVGDVLHATIADVTKGATKDNWRATVAIQTPYSKDKWPFLEGFLAIDEATTEVTFTLTGDIIHYIKQQGLIVGGKGYTLTSLTVEPAVYKGSENSIWLGQKTSAFTINSEHFKNANDLSGIAAGDIVRLSLTKNGNGWMQLKYLDGGSWKDMPNVTFTDTDTGRDYAVTEEMATILNKYGLIINFENRTITQVEIVKPAPAEGALWAGNRVIDGDNDQKVVLAASQLGSLQVGDVLHATITDVTTGWTSKVTLQLPYGDRPNLEEEFHLDKPTTDVAFTLTGDIIGYVKQYGLAISGKGFTLTKLHVEKTNNTGSENSVWVGHIDGSADITVRGAHFTNANELAGIAKGNIVRLHFTRGDEAWIQLKYNGTDTNWEWFDLPGAVITSTETGGDIVVTEPMVDILKTDGMIINFHNICITQVEIVKPEVPKEEVTEIATQDNAVYVEGLTGNIGRTMTMDIKLKNKQAILTYNFKLRLPDGVSVVRLPNGDFDYELSGRNINYSPTLVYDAQEQTYNMAVLSTVSGNDGTIATLKLQVGDDIAQGNYPINISDIEYTLDDKQYTSVDVPATTAQLTIGEKTYIKCDANDDDEVDIGDVVSVVNHVVNLPNDKFVAAAADVTGDGKTNLADALKIADSIVGNDNAEAPSPQFIEELLAAAKAPAIEMPEPQRPSYAPTVPQGLAEGFYADKMELMPGEDALLSIGLKNSQDARGYNFDLVLPEGVTLVKVNGEDCQLNGSRQPGFMKKVNYKDDVRSYSVAVYTVSTNVMAAGEGEVCTLKLHVADDAPLGRQAVSIQNNKYSKSKGSSVQLSRTEVPMTIGTMGDVNDDKSVDMKDVIAIVNYILSDGMTTIKTGLADIDGNHKVTITDAIALMSSMMGKD